MIQKAVIASVPSALEQSGMDSSKFTTDTLVIRELTGWKIARLSCLPGAAYPKICEGELPQRAGESRGAEPVILCLRPREWLFLDESDGISQSLIHSATENGTAFWADLSDGHAVFRIEGAGAPWLLSKLSCLDYQSCHSADDHCARTRMGQVAVVVHFHRTPDNDEVFDLILDRSIARYLWELLCASAPHASDLVRLQGVAA
jgi:heterotetrameric sarcosine oxidase gamma subunit